MSFGPYLQAQMRSKVGQAVVETLSKSNSLYEVVLPSYLF